MKHLALLTLLVGMIASALPAFASGASCPEQYLNNQSTVTLRNWSLYISSGSTESINLCRPLHVHKLYIQAEGYYTDSQAQVIVNGSVKGTLYVPGRDPSYVVTVEDDTSSIQIQSVYGSFKIHSVTAVVSEAYSDGYYPQPSPGPHVGHGTSLPWMVHSQMGKISSRVIWLVNNLEGYTNYATYGTYLLPIRKAAAEALAVSEARGDLSLSARTYYETLLTTLDNAAPYMQNAFEVDYALNLSIELMSMREKIRMLLQ